METFSIILLIASLIIIYSILLWDNIDNGILQLITKSFIAIVTLIISFFMTSKVCYDNGQKDALRNKQKYKMEIRYIKRTMIINNKAKVFDIPVDTNFVEIKQ